MSAEMDSAAWQHDATWPVAASIAADQRPEFRSSGGPGQRLQRAQPAGGTARAESRRSGPVGFRYTGYTRISRTCWSRRLEANPPLYPCRRRTNSGKMVSNPAGGGCMGLLTDVRI